MTWYICVYMPTLSIYTVLFIESMGKIKQENIEFIQFDVKIWNILKVWRQHNSTRLFIKL